MGEVFSMAECFGLGVAGEFVVGQGDDAGAGSAEEELVAFLRDGDFLVGQGFAIGAFDGDGGCSGAVFFDVGVERGG